MRFTKMHGIGNDYIYVDCFKETVPDPQTLARAIADRHFGVGGDGLILILPSEVADVKMRMFNADGSEAEMCGNGIRCLAKYAYDHRVSRSKAMRVETAAGIKTIKLRVGKNRKVTSATVDMGAPILDPPDIPVDIPQPRVVDVALRTSRQIFRMTSLSMGNPHAVVYVDNVTGVPLEQLGPEIEQHPVFPQGANVHFVQVLSPQEVTMRTWERGSGITLGCGTGAAAVCVAGVLTYRGERKITAHLPGGGLKLHWRESDDHVHLTGPAVEVFSGTWPT